jgi:hypothetical protein
MRRLSPWVVACTLLAAPVWAGISDPIPTNPCSSTRLRGPVLGVLDVSGGGCAGPAVQTAITCTLRKGKPTDTAQDIAVEFYSETNGASITGGPVCAAAGLAPGSTITMITGTVPSPAYTGAIVIPAPGGSCGPGCFLHGSARVFASGGMINCTATRVDLSEVCLAGKPVPATTKNLTVLRPQGVRAGKIVQRGD